MKSKLYLVNSSNNQNKITLTEIYNILNKQYYIKNISYANNFGEYLIINTRFTYGLSDEQISFYINKIKENIIIDSGTTPLNQFEYNQIDLNSDLIRLIKNTADHNHVEFNEVTKQFTFNFSLYATDEDVNNAVLAMLNILNTIGNYCSILKLLNNK